MNVKKVTVSQTNYDRLKNRREELYDYGITENSTRDAKNVVVWGSRSCDP